jgi:hypothetical protein
MTEKSLLEKHYLTCLMEAALEHLVRHITVDPNAVKNLGGLGISQTNRPRIAPAKGPGFLNKLSGFGYKDQNGDYISALEDMQDGGGRGGSGPRFEGGISGLSNAIGLTPYGSGREATGIAKFIQNGGVFGALAKGMGNSAMSGIKSLGTQGGEYAKGDTVNALAKKYNMSPEEFAKLNNLDDPNKIREGDTYRYGRPPSANQPTAMDMINQMNRRDNNDRAAPQNVGLPSVAAAAAPPTAIEYSEAAASGAFEPIPNPNYDPSAPQSPTNMQFLSNPTMDQLMRWKNRAKVPFVYAQGGLVGYAEGGLAELANMGNGGAEPAEMNEKQIVSSAVAAINEQMPEEQAAMALATFVQTFGEDALKDLIDRVMSGDLEETVQNGEGKIAGPGDGMNDRVPASIDGQQDVLLSDGEFIIPADVVSGLGNGSSEAGSKALERLMKRIREERTGNGTQPEAIDAESMMRSVA